MPFLDPAEKADKKKGRHLKGRLYEKTDTQKGRHTKRPTHKKADTRKGRQKNWKEEEFLSMASRFPGNKILEKYKFF